MNSETIHFDSIDAVYADPFYARFAISSTLRDIRKIHLKSLELPITFPNIRNSGTLNKITIQTNTADNYTISIAEINYTTLASLLTDINNAFVGVIPSTTVTFAQIGSTNRITCTLASSVVTSFSFVDTSLSKNVLGFRFPTYGALIVTSTVDYLLNVDNYISMYIANIQHLGTSFRLCSFKIPLTSSNGIIMFQADEYSLKQYIDLSYSGQIIDYLVVKIYDRFNNLISSNNADYSFTLMFEK